MNNQHEITSIGDLLLLLDIFPEPSRALLADYMSQCVLLYRKAYDDALREIRERESAHDSPDNSSNENEDVEKEVKKALETTLEKLETQEDCFLQPQSLQQQQKPGFLSFSLSENKVENEVKNKMLVKEVEKVVEVNKEKKKVDKEEEEKDDDLSEFRAWVLQQFSSWFDEDVLLLEEKIEEEKNEESDAQKQTTSSVAHLIINDFLSETNVLTTSINQPTFSPTDTVFCDPEFCELFRQPFYSPQPEPLQEQQQELAPPFLFSEKVVEKEVTIKEEKESEEEKDLAADISLASYLSFTTAPEDDEKNEADQLYFEADLEPPNTSSPFPTLPKAKDELQQKMEIISSADSTSAETVEPASTEDEEKENSTEVDSETSQNEDKEEGEEETSFVDERVIPLQTSGDGDELFEPFDFEGSKPSSAAATSGERNEPKEKKWPDDRDDPQLLAALSIISSGHNPDAIDPSTLDPFTSCIFCPSIAHCSIACPVYRTIVDRLYRVAYELHRCTICLAVDHKKDKCPLKGETVCESCGLSHAEMLFHEPSKNDSDKG